MKRQRKIHARTDKRDRSRKLVLEILEDRLPPGDTALATLLTGWLTGQATVLLDPRERGVRPDAGASSVGSEVSVANHSAVSILAGSAVPDGSSNATREHDPFAEDDLFGQPAPQRSLPRLSDSDPLEEKARSSAGAGGVTPGLDLAPTLERNEAPQAENQSANQRPPTVRSGKGLDPALTAALAGSQVPANGNPIDPPAPAAAPTASDSPPAVTGVRPSGSGGNIANITPPAGEIFCKKQQSPGGALLVPSWSTTGVTSSYTLATNVTYTLIAEGDVQVGSLRTQRADAQYQDFSQPRSVGHGRCHPGGTYGYGGHRNYHASGLGRLPAGPHLPPPGCRPRDAAPHLL